MILEQNLHFLRQGRDLLSTLEAQLYAEHEPGRSPIGAHMRHCVDYYRCFLEGLETGKIDYDARERDPDLESQPHAASQALDDISGRLAALDPADFFRVLEVKVDTPEDAMFTWSRSTMLRELQFLVGHTVHHYALIGFLLRQKGIDPGDDFGVAPSTLEYRSTMGRSTVGVGAS